jgi:hypothetical protein
VSGNPAGRPKQAASRLLREMAVELTEGSNQTRLRRIVDQLLAKPEGGDLEAIRIVFDRMEGRPRQALTIDTDEQARLERKVQHYLQESEAEGDPLTREQVIAVLTEEDARFENYE